MGRKPKVVALAAGAGAFTAALDAIVSGAVVEEVPADVKIVERFRSDPSIRRVGESFMKIVVDGAGGAPVSMPSEGLPPMW